MGTDNAEAKTNTGAEQTATTGEQGSEVPHQRRGFAVMDRERVKEIARKGGRAAHVAGTAHHFNSDEARTAGRKGGLAPHTRRGGPRRRPAVEESPPSTQRTGVAPTATAHEGV